MSVADFVDIQVEQFGGYAPAFPAAALPAGASPLNQDVMYPQGSVRTRPGTGTGIITGLLGNPTINYIKTFTDQQQNFRNLYLDSLGVLRQDFPAGTETILNGVQGIYALTTRARSATLFGREYIAGSNAGIGQEMPMQFDTVNFDRISQCGPGAPPAASDAQASGNITASPNGLLNVTDTSSNGSTDLNDVGYVTWTMNHAIPVGVAVGDFFVVSSSTNASFNGTYQITAINSSVTIIAQFQGAGGPGNPATTASATITYNLTTVVMTANFAAVVGTQATIAGAGVSGYNGTWTIVSITNATTFVVKGVGDSLAASGNGTIVGAGVVTAGLHQFVVIFVTRQNYLTKPSPAGSWTAAGSLGVKLTGIPKGPSNIIARIIAFTAAGGATFYYLSNQGNPSATSSIIYDNTTTTINLNFSDTTLQASPNVLNPSGSTSSRLNVLELGECSNLIGYANRLVASGERNKVYTAQNLSFDGGWALGGGTGGSDLPLGWMSDMTNGTGGSRDQTNFLWGDAYRITGDGSSAKRGMITQAMYYDAFGVRLLRDQTAYSYRVRLKSGGGITQGNAVLELFSPSGGSLAIVTIPQSSLNSSTFTEFNGTLIAATTFPSDVVLRVYTSGTVNNGGYIVFENIEPFPTGTPTVNGWRLSYINDPESFDGVTGLIQVRAGDGQLPRASWVIRGNLYLLKDHYTAYTTDDGKSEPSSWSITEVSSTIGCVGPDAIDGTEEWFVFVDQSGIYIINGGDPIKISQEISEDASNTGKITFKSINMAAASTIWVRIDDVKKRILIGAPVNGATSPNVIFMMDYRFSSTAEYIAAGPGVVYSTFSGKIISHGGARKWSPWNISSNACGMTENIDGTTHTWLGGKANGKIYDLLDTNTSDDGAAINSFYQGSGTPDTMQEQMLQVRAHRKLYGAVTGRITGSGAMSVTVSSMTNLNGIVTVTMSGAHGLTTGNWTYVSGAADPTYNGVWQITVTGANTFTYVAATATNSTSGATVANTFQLKVITPLRTTNLRGGILANELRDFERYVNVHAERAYFQVGTNAPGAWFQLEKLCPVMKVDPTMPLAGVLS